MKRPTFSMVLAVGGFLAGAAAGRADNWPSWRGPDNNGVSNPQRCCGPERTTTLRELKSEETDGGLVLIRSPGSLFTVGNRFRLP